MTLRATIYTSLFGAIDDELSVYAIAHNLSTAEHEHIRAVAHRAMNGLAAALSGEEADNQEATGAFLSLLLFMGQVNSRAA